MTSPTKNSNPKLPKFFRSKVQVFLHLLRVWTVLALWWCK